MYKNDLDNMITKFGKLYENNEDIIINIENENDKLINKIKNHFSLITYKRKNNPKQIRLKKISGYFDKNDFKNTKLIKRTYLNLELTNNDNIKAKLSIYNDSEDNNISIKLNDKLLYDIDNENFNNDVLINKMIDKYKDHLKLQKIKLRNA